MKNRSIGSVQDLGDGRYRLRVSAGFDDFGRRVQPSKVVTAKSETDAEKQLLKLYNETRGTSSGSDKTAPKTLGALYDCWMHDHVEPSLEARTQEYYKDLWKRYLEDKRGTKVTNLRPAVVQKIIKDVKAGARTKQGVFAMLRAIFNRTKRWGYIDHNPCDNIDPPRYESDERDVFSRSDLDGLVKALETTPIKYQLAVWLALSRGMRREEIAGLKWGDIDLAEKTINIRRAVVRVKKQGMIEKAPKSKGSERKLGISDDLDRLFRAHWLEQAQQADQLGDKWVGDGWVFTTWNGELASSDSLSNWWARFLDENDIKRIRFHDLRHTAASLMLASTADILSVSGVLGHSRKSTTLNIYGHMLDDGKAQTLQIMDDIMTDASGAKNNM